jgi:hypothetical protein
VNSTQKENLRPLFGENRVGDSCFVRRNSVFDLRDGCVVGQNTGSHERPNALSLGLRRHMPTRNSVENRSQQPERPHFRLPTAPTFTIERPRQQRAVRGQHDFFLKTARQEKPKKARRTPQTGYMHHIRRQKLTGQPIDKTRWKILAHANARVKRLHTIRPRPAIREMPQTRLSIGVTRQHANGKTGLDLRFAQIQQSFHGPTVSNRRKKRRHDMQHAQLPSPVPKIRAVLLHRVNYLYTRFTSGNKPLKILNCFCW